MAASNSLPDAAMMPEDQVLRWAASGRLMDLSDLFTGESEQVIEQVKFKYNNKIVAYSLAEETIILYYNRSIFDQARIPYPPAKAEEAWTWAQFVEVAKKLTKDQAGKTPNDSGFDPKKIATYGVAFNYSPYFWPVLGTSNGGGWFSEDGKNLLINSPETVEVAQAIADLYLKDRCSADPFLGVGDAAMAMLSGQVAMAIEGQYSIGLQYLNAMKEGLDYGVGVIPKFKKPVTTNTGAPAVVFNSSKHKTEAREIIKQLYDPEKNLLFITTGIWQPTRKSWYTDEEKIKSWADHPNRPPLEEYRHAVINYTLNNAIQAPYFYFPKCVEFSEILNTKMEPVWRGTKNAKAALDEAYQDIRKLMN
jgi:multiple sugar transport system substrate-binding protein